MAHISQITHPDDVVRDAAIAAALHTARIDIVALTGYLKALGWQVLAHFAGRIINTHPSLLPRFGGAGLYGKNVHATVLASGAERSGASIHHVTRDYDTGPVIAQRELAINPGETAASLEQRIKPLEQRLLVDVLRCLAIQQVPLLTRLSSPVGYVIQPAAPRHLAALPAIELAAATLFSRADLPAAWATAATPDATLQLACKEQRLLVAVTHDDIPVGAALVDSVDDTPHLHQVDVHPEHARRGIGAALVRHVLERARCQHASAMTLTTFVHVPWNAPFYERCGFVRLDESVTATAMGPGLRTILAAERAGGLRNRIAMRATL